MYFVKYLIVGILLLAQIRNVWCQSTDCQKNTLKIQQLYKDSSYAAAIQMAQTNITTCLNAGYEEGYYQNARILVLSYLKLKEIKKAHTAIDKIIAQVPQNSRHLLGKCYFLKGRIHDETENQALALKYFERSIQQIVPIDTFSPPYNNSSYLYGNLGDYTKKIQYLDKAVAINQTQGEKGKEELRKNYNNLADAYIYGFKKYDIGIEYAEKAITILPMKPSAKANIHLAWAWSEQKDSAKALTFCKKALKIAAETKNMREVANTYYTFGHIYEINNQYKQALKYYKGYLELSKKEKNKPDIIEAQAAIGHLLAKKGDYWGALQYFQDGLMGSCEHFLPKNLSENPSKTQQTTNIIAALLLAKGEIWANLAKEKNEVSYLHNAIATHEAGFYALRQAKSDFSEDLSKWNLTAQYSAAFESAILTTIALYERTCDSIFLEKAVYFADQSRSVSLRENIILQQAKELAGIPDSLLQQEQILNQAIVQLERQKTPNAATNDSIFEAKRQLDAYKASLKTQYPKCYELAYQSDMTFKIADVQSILSKDQLVIQYFQGKKDLFTFTIHPTRGVQYYRQPYLIDFDSTLQKFLRTTSDWAFFVQDKAQSSQDFLDTSPILYDFLLKKPLEATPDCKRFIVVPDGKLSYVPFQCLLMTPYKGKINDRAIISHYVLHEYDVSRAYGLDILLHQYNTKHKLIANNNGTFGGFASSYEDKLTLAYSDKKDMTGIFSSLSLRSKPFGGKLPHAIAEVNNAQNIWGGRVFLNGNATKENFLSHAKEYNIVQLALHAAIDDHNPLNSALVFTKKSLSDDNFLRISEIYQMNIPDELTVLNACSTGGGTLQKGEGIISLDRAFARAGSNSLLTNLAPIEDKAIGFINKAFNQYLKMGMLKDKALRTAKLDYLQSTEVSSQHVAPIYWANSVITGNVNPLSSSKPPFHTANMTFGYSILGVSTVLIAFFMRKNS